jgi:hypothetical protein
MRILDKIAGAVLATAVVTAGLLSTTPAQAGIPASATAVRAGGPVAADGAMTPIYSRIVPGKLQIDRRCMTGRVLCINKTIRKVVLLLNGKVLKTADARFGRRSTPTRMGVFKVYSKDRDHVSSLYHSPMPYAMFFSRGQAVHYSADFAARGYNGHSHGCVNVRNKKAIAYLFGHVPIGTRVIVYRS